MGLATAAESLFTSHTLSQDKEGHSRAVADTARAIASRMGPTIAVDPEAAYAAGLLHDLGLSLRGQLTERDEELDPWPEHAIAGARIALEAGFPRAIVTSIQSHEGVGYTQAEMAELKLDPPAIGKTWGARSALSKVLATADELVFLTRHLSVDPWRDHAAIRRYGHPYLDTIYRKRAGHAITDTHPVLMRLERRIVEVLPWARAGDVPPPWPGLARSSAAAWETETD